MRTPKETGFILGSMMLIAALVGLIHGLHHAWTEADRQLVLRFELTAGCIAATVPTYRRRTSCPC